MPSGRPVVRLRPLLVCVGCLMGEGVGLAQLVLVKGPPEVHLKARLAMVLCIFVLNFYSLSFRWPMIAFTGYGWRLLTCPLVDKF